MITGFDRMSSILTGWCLCRGSFVLRVFRPFRLTEYLLNAPKRTRNDIGVNCIAGDISSVQGEIKARAV